MAQANTNNSTSMPVDSTRRRFLSQAASVAAGSAVLAVVTTAPLPAIALQGLPDPILQAIEAHKAARATWIGWVDRHSDLETELPRDKRQSRCDAWEEKIVATDDPRWIEAEPEIMRTSDLETDAACVLVSIVPTTLAGVVALLKYAMVADTDGEGWPSDLQSGDGTKTRSWHYFLIENITAALTDLVMS
jgi:hypothetical protein